MLKKYFLLITVLVTIFSFGQNPAMIENTFNTNNISNVSGGVFAGFDKCFPLPDGKILVYKGGCTGCRFNGFVIRNVERLNANGTLDVTFNPSGVGFSSSISDVHTYADGKILVSGSFTSYNGVSVNGLVKLNADGSRDSSFSTSLNNSVSDILVQTDGKIIIAGAFTSYSGTAYNRILRLNTDGSVDTSFSIGTGFNTTASVMALQSDAKIIVGGNFTTYNGVTANRIIRLNDDGSVDSSFNTTTGFNAIVNSICFSSDNKIFVGGGFTTYKGATSNRIIKLNLDGSKDTSFIVGGFDNTVNKVVLLSGGNIAAVGSFFYYGGSYYSGTVKLNAIGVADNQSLLTRTSFVKDLFVQNDGEIIVTGDFSSIGSVVVNNIARFNSDESLDTTDFAIGVGLDYGATKVERQSDGKLLVCGNFTAYNTTSVNTLIRLNDDGTLDSSFNTGTGFSGGGSNRLYSLKTQADGKIIVGGVFASYNGTATNCLVRLNNDGTIDPTFNIGTGFNGRIRDIIVQADGKIIIAGAFSTFNGNTSHRYIVRLNTNGSLDVPFPTAGDEVNVIALQNDGKLVAGFASGYIRRYNTNGSLDTTFTAPVNSVSNEGVLALQIQSSNKIIVGGDFSIATNNLIRLNTNGSKDTSFATGTGFNGVVRSLVVQPDDKIIVGGSYNMYNGTTGWHAIRLNPNGSVDPTFDTGIGFTGSIYDIKLQDDGKIIMAGTMVNYNSYVIGGLVRLIGGGFYSLSGQNKLDANLNGCDVADYPFPNLKMNFNDGFSNYDFFVNNTGDYSMLLSQGNYTITPIVNSNFTISPTSITANFPSQFTSLVQNYCITPLNGSYADLDIQIIPLNNARPGFDSKYKIVYKNKGVVSQSGTVNMVFDDQVMDMINAVPVFSSQSINSLTWNFSNLSPQETRTILVDFNLNTPTETPSLNSGDVLHFNVAFSGELTDFTPSDNTFVLNQNVINSYDPNDKTCLQGEFVGTEKIGDYVHYLIRFENNGTANAEFIRIEDVIDSAKFEIATLEPLSGSHNFITKISDSNKVEFFFNNINLPFDDANNDGYVMYKIKLKSSLVNGDSFSNTANIYFDFNSAIVTNTATTTITTLGNEENIAENGFYLYPNPTKDFLTINNKSGHEIKSVSVYNAMGQLILKVPNAKSASRVNVQRLSAGHYFMKFETENGMLTTKFIKQ